MKAVFANTFLRSIEDLGAARFSARAVISDFLIPAGNVGRIPELRVALYFEGDNFRMA
jgi:hypothetical protein